MPHWKQQQNRSINNSFVLLKFMHDEAAQFDWSTETIFIEGMPRSIKLAHMKLCSSRAFNLTAYQNEAHEMLFDNNRYIVFGWYQVPCF